MDFARPLVPARLIRRYKRFLADVVLDGGAEETVHCPNPGAMTGLAEEGMRVWLEPALPGRSLKYGWRLVELPTGGWAGIDTSVPNRVVGEALAKGAIPALAGYQTVKSEVRYGVRSRVDFLLTDPKRPDCYVEVKNAHLKRAGDGAEFPDSVTARGAKHLEELGHVAKSGKRAVVLFVVQRDDCRSMRLAPDIDPRFAAAAARAMGEGVEIIAYGTKISVSGVTLADELPFAPPGHA